MPLIVEKPLHPTEKFLVGLGLRPDQLKHLLWLIKNNREQVIRYLEEKAAGEGDRKPAER